MKRFWGILLLGILLGNSVVSAMDLPLIAEPFQCYALSPDENFIALGLGKESIKVYQFIDQEWVPFPILCNSASSFLCEISSLEFSPDGQRLSAKSKDFVVKVFQRSKQYGVDAFRQVAPTGMEYTVLEGDGSGSKRFNYYQLP